MPAHRLPAPGEGGRYSLLRVTSGLGLSAPMLIVPPMTEPVDSSRSKAQARMTVRLDVDAYSLAARLRERLDHEMLAEVADLLRRTEEVQTSRYYRTGTCEAMVPGEPLPIADEAALGTDERWHPLHLDTAVMLCDHTTWYPKERPAPTLVTPRATRSNPHRPRSRCAINPHRHEHASHTRNGNTLTQSMCVRGR